MKHLLLFLLAFPAFASSSLILGGGAGGLRTQGQFNGGPWASITNQRIEIQMDTWVSQSASVGIFELDSSLQLIVDSGNNLVFRGYNNESMSIALGTCVGWRARAQRNTVLVNYTLEMWCEATGTYTVVTVADTSPGAVNKGVTHFSVGSFGEPNSPSARIGMVRVYSTNLATNSTLPQRFINSSFADMLDYELEVNLTESSGVSLSSALAVTQGSATYATTVVINPAVSTSNLPVSSIAGVAGTLTGLSAFANQDSTTLTCLYSQNSGVSGAFTNASNCTTATFNPGGFGTANLQVIVTDASANASTSTFKFGGTIANAAGVVNVAAEAATLSAGNATKIATIVGPIMAWGRNPWSWFDNRMISMANNQSANQASGQPFDNWFDTASAHGTISVTHNSTTITGSSTQFQTDFCGGPGNTTLVGGTAPVIIIWYSSTVYAGQTGRGRYNVMGCPSQTSLTVNTGFEPANESGLSYSVDATGALTSNWTFGSIPGNYYDNVEAFYATYFATGIDTYLTAARTLAARVWEIMWDKGNAYTSGTFQIGPPARAVSAMGMSIWGLESGPTGTLWPGIQSLWTAVAAPVSGYIAATVTNGQVGDIREMGYETSIVSLCVLADPSPPAQCANALRNVTDNLWGALGPLAGGNWTNTQTNVNYADAGAAIYATTTNGSPNVTLTGSTWNCSNVNGTFTNANISGANYGNWLWFYNNPLNPNVPGNSNAGTGGGTGGDAVAYQITSCTDSTHVVLSTNYVGPSCFSGTPSSCKHGLMVTGIAGFGTQPFMMGLAAGAFAREGYNAFVQLGDATRAATIKGFAQSALTWMESTGIDAYDQGSYGARQFLNCEPTPNIVPGCGSGNIFNGESFRMFSGLYALAPSAPLKTAGDAFFNAVFCKPGGAYTCNGMNPQQYTILSATAANPMVLTLSSVPSTISNSGGAKIYISGATGAGCSGMNTFWQTDAVTTTTTVTIPFNGTGCTYAGSSAQLQEYNYSLDDGQFMDAAGVATANKWFGYYWGFGFGSAWAAVTAQSATPGSVMNGRSVMSGAAVVH